MQLESSDYLKQCTFARALENAGGGLATFNIRLKSELLAGKPDADGCDGRGQDGCNSASVVTRERADESAPDAGNAHDRPLREVNCGCAMDKAVF